MRWNYVKEKNIVELLHVRITKVHLTKNNKCSGVYCSYFIIFKRNLFEFNLQFLSFNSFEKRLPKTDHEQRIQWIKAIEEQQQFTQSSGHYNVCIRHFNEVNLIERNGKYILKTDAIPSIFNGAIETNDDTSPCIFDETNEANDDGDNLQECKRPSCIYEKEKMVGLQLQIQQMKLEHDTQLQYFRLKVEILNKKLKESDENKNNLTSKLKKNDKLLKHETDELNNLKIEIEQLKLSRYISTDAANGANGANVRHKFMFSNSLIFFFIFYLFILIYALMLELCRRSQYFAHKIHSNSVFHVSIRYISLMNCAMSKTICFFFE